MEVNWRDSWRVEGGSCCQVYTTIPIFVSLEFSFFFVQIEKTLLPYEIEITRIPLLISLSAKNTARNVKAVPRQ